MIKMYAICHLAESQFTNSHLNWVKKHSGGEKEYIYTIFQETFVPLK